MSNDPWTLKEFLQSLPNYANDSHDELLGGIATIGPGPDNGHIVVRRPDGSWILTPREQIAGVEVVELTSASDTYADLSVRIALKAGALSGNPLLDELRQSFRANELERGGHLVTTLAHQKQIGDFCEWDYSASKWKCSRAFQ